METQSFDIDGPVLIKPKVFQDARGYFFESYNQATWSKAGITEEFVQDNESLSCRNTIRGLHYQINKPQAKLVRVVRGSVWDVAVDIRPGSRSFGRWVGAELSQKNQMQMYIPAGFAHGFQVLSEEAVFVYKVSALFAAEFDRGILWSDPDLAIPWPGRPPLLSPKDQNLPKLSDIDTDEKRV